MDILYPINPKLKKVKKTIFKNAVINPETNPKKEYNLILSFPLI